MTDFIRRFKNSFVALSVLFCLVVSGIAVPVIPAEAEEFPCLPTYKDNLDIKRIKTTSMAATDDGFIRLVYDGEKIIVEDYDDEFNILGKRFIDMELPYWGGFYASEDAYYIVEGQPNKEEDDSKEVVRVIKYDKSWNRLGAAAIIGKTHEASKVRYPFNTGNIKMTEFGGKLYIATGHQGYIDEAFGIGHQGLWLIEVDTTSMTGEVIIYNLLHSFNQYVDNSDGKMYLLELSEGYRATILSEWTNSANGLTGKRIRLLEYGGERTSQMAAECYATVNDIAVSADNILGLGTSIDQSKYDTYTGRSSYNIYLSVTPKNSFSNDSTSLKWLTDYADNPSKNVLERGKDFYDVNLTKINDNRFMISWEEMYGISSCDLDDPLTTYTLHYIFIDGAGNKISDEFTASAPISDCHPILKGSRLVYCASAYNTVNFYSIDAYTGEFSKKVYRVLGEHAVWDIEDGVLTVSGSGKISSVDSKIYRTDVPAKLNMDNNISYQWGPVQKNIEKLVVKGGITEISVKTFKGLNYIKEAVVEEGVEVIDEEAFLSCDILRDVYLPDSVSTIGEDIFWTGGYSIFDNSHATIATIHANGDSYAAQYARDNNIKFKDLNNASQGNAKENTSKDETPQIPENTTETQEQVPYTSEQDNDVPIITDIPEDRKPTTDVPQLIPATPPYSSDNSMNVTKGNIAVSGIYCSSTYPSIVAGLVIDNKESISGDIEYRWLACDEADGEWFEVSPWTKNNEWINWTPEKSGNYVFICYARLAGDFSSQVYSSFGTTYNKHIKDICQMPYWGEGGGYLIGFETYDNPNQEYQYEMFVMDLSLYSQGIENCWVHRTMPIKLTAGENPSDGKTLWTIWQPEYGYYLTLFRLYDKDGNIIDEVCYGFVNAY